MFGIGSTELLLILLVALIVLGPKSLAGFSRKLGRAMGEVRKVSTEFQRTLNVEAAEAEMREAEKKRAAQAKTGKESAPEQQEAKAAANPASDSVEHSAANNPSVNAAPASETLSAIPKDSPLSEALENARRQAGESGQESRESRAQ